MKLGSFIKKNMLTFILVIALLCVQAIGTITLPEYISKIVDTGIRNYGLENSVPKMIRESEMNKMLYFIKNDNILDSFELKSSEEFFNSESSIKENIYVLKDNADIEKLNDEFARAIAIVQLIDNFDDVSSTVGVIDMSTINMISSVDSNSVWGYLDTVAEFNLRDINRIIDSKLIVVSDDILLQLASQYIVNEYEVLGTPNIQMNYIIKSVLEMIFITIIVLIATVLQSYYMSKFVAQMSEWIRGNIFKRILNLRKDEFEKFSITTLINRTILDTQIIERSIPDVLQLSVYVPIIFMGAYVKIKKLSNNTNLENILVVIFISVFVIGMATYAIIIPLAKKLQKGLDRINSFERDSLNNLFLIKGNAKPKQKEKFANINDEIVKNQGAFLEGRNAATILSTLIIYLAGVYMLWQGGIKIDLGVLSIGGLMAIMDYLFKISFTCIEIFKKTLRLLKSVVSYSRCKEVLSSEIDNTNKLSTCIDNIETIEFKNVYFKYPDSKDYVVKDFSLQINKGDHVAIIGKNASGKSTLVKLLLKFYKIEQGEILINGINIEKINTKNLRKKMGIVLQESKVFEGALSHNIKFGNDELKDKEIERIKEIAALDEFKNIDQNIVYKGKNVSGGQKQRIAIARALAMKPDVMVLDSAFSSVDEDTKKTLQHNLQNVCKENIVLDICQEKNKYFDYTKVVEL